MIDLPGMVTTKGKAKGKAIGPRANRTPGHASGRPHDTGTTTAILKSAFRTCRSLSLQTATPSTPLWNGGRVGILTPTAEKADFDRQLFNDLLEVKPTVLKGVPKFWEQVLLSI